MPSDINTRSEIISKPCCCCYVRCRRVIACSVTYHLTPTHLPPCLCIFISCYSARPFVFHQPCHIVITWPFCPRRSVPHFCPFAILSRGNALLSRQKEAGNGHGERLPKNLSLKQMTRVIIQCLCNQIPLSNSKEMVYYIVCSKYNLIFIYYQFVYLEKVGTVVRLLQVELEITRHPQVCRSPCRIRFGTGEVNIWQPG